MEQLDSLQINLFESLLKTANDISRHTNAWGGAIPSFITVVTVLAAIATLAGLWLIWVEIRQRRYTKARQTLLLKDLIRHLFVNASIMEALQISSGGKWDKVRPADGVFTRFSILESDFMLDDIRIKDNDFLRLHSLKVFLRNYNISAQVAEKTFKDPSIPISEKNAEIFDLWKRTRRAVEELLELGIATKLFSGDIFHQEDAKNEVAAFIKKYYEKENLMVTPIALPTRTNDKVFFDDPDFGLKEELDKRITCRIKDIRIVAF